VHKSLDVKEYLVKANSPHPPDILGRVNPDPPEPGAIAVEATVASIGLSRVQNSG